VARNHICLIDTIDKINEDWYYFDVLLDSTMNHRVNFHGDKAYEVAVFELSKFRRWYIDGQV